MIDHETLRQYLLSKPATTEEFPFGPGAAVYKVMGKMFALRAEDSSPPSISLKCEPNLAIMLRDTYPAVTQGYHLNHRHWNTVLVDGSIPDDEIFEMIDHSFEQVVKGLPKRVRESLR